MLHLPILCLKVLLKILILRLVRGKPTLGVPSPEALPFLFVGDGKVAVRDPFEVACD